MKYIDRTRIGIALFLEQLSPMTSPLNKHTAEETVELLQQDSYSVQTDECKRIQGGLRRLISTRYELKDTIPARVRMVAESQFTPTPERLLPVFRWAQNLRRDNEQARIRWLYALKDVSSSLCDSIGEFLRAFSDIAAQRVTLLPGDGTVTLSVPDSLWGQVALKFNGTLPDGLPPAPVFGYLFWAEADRTESGYEFRFLLDTEFSSVVYQERLLQADNWTEVTLRCTGADLTVTQHDYTVRAESYGYSGLNAVMLCLGELMRKQTMLGVNALNGAENRLFGTALLFAQLGMLPNPLQSSSELSATERLMGNRYQLTQTAALFERECGVPGAVLGGLLREVSDDFEDENSAECRKKLEKFRSLVIGSCQDGSNCAISHPMLRLLREASSEYHDAYPFEEKYQDAQHQIEDAIADFLASGKFKGQFPHYSRLRGAYAEYLTIVGDEVPVTTAEGVIHLNYSIAAAKCRVRFKDGKATVFDRPYDQLHAPEFEPAEVSGCRFGRVLNPAQDHMECYFCYRYTPHEDDEKQRTAAAALILYGLRLACLGLEGHRLPPEYRPHTRELLRKEHIFSDLFNRTMIAGLPMVVAVMLLLHDQMRGSLMSVAITAGAVGAGLLTALLVTQIRYMRLQRTIWKR